MTQPKHSVNDAHKPVKRAADKAAGGFSAEERDAMKARAKELKEAHGGKADGGKADGEAELRAKIAELPEADRPMAERLHEIVMASAPQLAPRTWYGMPAYAKDGKVICFFQGAQKFKTRYSTLGFSDGANLDDGTMWPTSFALTTLTGDEEVQIAALVKKAIR